MTYYEFCIFIGVYVIAPIAGIASFIGVIVDISDRYRTKQ